MSGSDSNGRPGTLPDESGSSAASASSAGSSGGSVSDSDDWEVAAAQSGVVGGPGTLPDESGSSAAPASSAGSSGGSWSPNYNPDPKTPYRNPNTQSQYTPDLSERLDPNAKSYYGSPQGNREGEVLDSPGVTMDGTLNWMDNMLSIILVHLGKEPKDIWYYTTLIKGNTTFQHICTTHKSFLQREINKKDMSVQYRSVYLKLKDLCTCIIDSIRLSETLSNTTKNSDEYQKLQTQQLEVEMEMNTIKKDIDSLIPTNRGGVGGTGESKSFTPTFTRLRF